MNKKKTQIILSVVFAGALLLGFIFADFKVSENGKKQDERPEKEAVKAESGEDPELKKEKFHPDSIPAMMKKDFQGDNLKLGKTLDGNASYTRYYMTYASEGLEISGTVYVPEGQGPFPIVIANHGYIDPEVYKNGQGLQIFEQHLAKEGYVVFHSDYRNHADSDFDPRNDIRPRSGYVEDVMNLISAVRKSDYAFLDKDRMGMMGHSMGGGITLNVMAIAPESIKAYVLLAPISADYKKNFDRWVAKEWPDLAEQILGAYGTFEGNPDFWASVSAVNYFKNIGAPVELHQGTADSQVPVEWSRDLADKLKKDGKEITYFEYPGEEHMFMKNFRAVMRRTTDFFDGKMGVGE